MANKQKNRTRWAKKYFKKNTGKAKQDFHLTIKEDYERAMERACELLSINRQQAAHFSPVIITIPDAFGKHDTVSYRLDINKDGSTTLIYDHSLVTILMFSEHSLLYYQSHINHETGQIGYDITGEIKHFDIVFVETELTFDDHEKPKYSRLDVKLNLVNGQNIKLHLRNHRLTPEYPMEQLLTDKEKQVIQLIKKSVRRQV
ncbi:MAG: hypothetical protein ACNA7K_03595 [Acholeplasmataceae bacterium]